VGGAGVLTRDVGNLGAGVGTIEDRSLFDHADRVVDEADLDADGEVCNQWVHQGDISLPYGEDDIWDELFATAGFSTQDGIFLV
jgi:hypothetical protein